MDPLKDGKSKIELIDHMGGDLAVVNDARCSFEKESVAMSERDIKLLRYLINHEHTSPLRGTAFKFKVKAPLFICRQWWKHVIGSNHNDEQLGWNEKSFRYTAANDPNEFYIPSSFRQQSTSNRQATQGALEPHANQEALEIYQAQCDSSYTAYERLLGLGVGREQARGVLVPSVYTSWVWTASLQSVLHFIELRQGHGAQSEIGAYAVAITELITPIVSHSMEAWQSKHTAA